ncbi:hypothetical protein ACE1CD_26940 [Aerosakkonema sp. BLCC-F183]|uniref:hypothetical protein n=1 Tax=Aerosakkonema sp. BLCC-F183 TaxID=3342834 RepID=UPI0035B7191F
MSDRDRINKLLKVLREGSEAVRRNPSENNYKRFEKQIERAGQRTNPWRWVIGLTVSSIVALLFIYIVNQSHKNYSQKNNKNYSFNFPMIACGDQTSGGTNRWYPIYINYNQQDLIRVRKYFCCDAFYDHGVGKIQIASFYNRSRAEQLVAELKAQNFKNAKVGAGDVVNTSPSSNQNNCK